jgi:hypothetical protein
MVFGKIENNKTTTINYIDHISNKTSIHILVLAVKLHHEVT